MFWAVNSAINSGKPQENRQKQNIAEKQNMCYDNSGKNLSGANENCAYTKDKMDRFFLSFFS